MQSHHRPREGPFEANDIFAIINAAPAIALLAYGFFNTGFIPGLCFGAVSHLLRFLNLWFRGWLWPSSHFGGGLEAFAVLSVALSCFKVEANPPVCTSKPLAPQCTLASVGIKTVAVRLPGDVAPLFCLAAPRLVVLHTTLVPSQVPLLEVSAPGRRLLVTC